MNESMVHSLSFLLGGAVSLCAPLHKTFILLVPAPAVREESVRLLLVTRGKFS